MIFKLSEAANLAIHSLVYLAENRKDEPVSTKNVALAFRASQNHLSKVFQQLARLGLVKSSRGPGGGFCLGLEPDEITLLEILEAIDGPLTEDECLFEHSHCNRRICIFGDLVQDVNFRVREYFENTTICDVMEN